MHVLKFSELHKGRQQLLFSVLKKLLSKFKGSIRNPKGINMIELIFAREFPKSEEFVNAS